jgi:hypothetical protein
MVVLCALLVVVERTKGRRELDQEINADRVPSTCAFVQMCVISLSLCPLTTNFNLDLSELAILKRTFLHDFPLLLLLISLFSVPLVFLPSISSALYQAAHTFLVSLGWFVSISLVLAVAIGAVLVGEKLIRRWTTGGARVVDDGHRERVGDASVGSSVDEQRRAKRFRREERMDDRVEGVVKLAGRAGHKVAKLWRRKGTGKGRVTEEVEMVDVRGEGSSSSVRREPLPLPPR